MASNRPKGFIEWTPNAEWAPVIGAVHQICEEYHEHLPLTVRQIFYRLVGVYGFAKTEQAYNNLANALVKARRARLVPFSWIRDDGGTTRGGRTGYDSIAEFLEDLRTQADDYARDTMTGQPYHIEMFCEAEGMVPMLGKIVRDYGVSVTGTGGFASVTVNYGLAAAAANRKIPTIFMHLGDFDPSGVSIFESMSQDIGKFVAGMVGGKYHPQTGQTFLSENDDGPDFRPMRIALTPEQIEEYDLESAPPKRSDSRSARWVGETTQLEAMAPDQIEEVVRDAINPWIDWDKVRELDNKSYEEKQLIDERVIGVMDELIQQNLEETDED